MDEEKYIKECYTVGSYGPYPIQFSKRLNQYFYFALEQDENGPFETLKAAVEHAELYAAHGDGGFHESLDDAEAHAEWMRQQGYGVE